MRAKLIRTVKRHELLKKGDKVLVACSGGPDSVALLHLLHQLRYKYKLALYLAHVNHGLRGRESNSDERFVRGLAEKLGIPILVKKADVKKLAEQKGLNLEEAARLVRYEFFESLVEKHKLDKIATGHTLNDQAETVLMRLLRGAGPTGLSGIPIKRGKIIRPLLETTREEILDYLKQNKIKFRIDKTNLKSDYLRNKIRNKLLPGLLKEYNPNLTKVLGRTAALFSELEEQIEKQTEKVAQRILSSPKDGVVQLKLRQFQKFPTILQRNLIRMAWENLSKEIYPLDFDQVERVLDLANPGTVGQRVNLKKNYWAEKEQNQLALFRQTRKKTKVRIPVPGKLAIPQIDLEISSKVVSRKKLPAKIVSMTERAAYLDLDMFTELPLLRSWQKGDRFKPLGLEGTKKVSDFFTDLKVPRYQRSQIPLLCSNGRIAWVVGYRISEEFKVRPETKKVLCLQAASLQPSS
jgi:tRNA(Ile)-lysidine synthase